MKNTNKGKRIITTRELGKYILEKGKCPTPIYHGRGYKETSRAKPVKF